jgi:hypothetical protein
MMSQFISSSVAVLFFVFVYTFHLSFNLSSVVSYHISLQRTLDLLFLTEISRS